MVQCNGDDDEQQSDNEDHDLYCGFNQKIKLTNSMTFSDVRGVTNRKTILEGYENVQAALLDYTLTCYPSVSVRGSINTIAIFLLIVLYVRFF